MSDLSKLVAAPKSIPELPGKTLTPFDWTAYGAAEEAFDVQHRRRAALAAEGQTPPIQDKLIAAASFDGQSGAFAYGSLGFDAKVRSGSCLDLLLWLALKPCHPKTTREDAAALITPENRRPVQRAVMECMAYDFTPPPVEKKDGGTDSPNDKTGEGQSPGETSTKASESEG